MKAIRLLSAAVCILFSLVGNAQWTDNADTTYTFDKVGIGTMSPKADLNITNVNSNALLLIESPYNSSVNRSISTLQLKNSTTGEFYHQALRRMNGLDQVVHSVYRPTLQQPWVGISCYTINDGTYGFSNGITNMLFNNTGNIGVGTSTPISKLDIRTLGSTLPIATFSSDKDAIKDSTITFSAGGTIGIGTTTPLYKLHVVTRDQNFTTITMESKGGGGGAGFRMIDSVSAGDWTFKTTSLGHFKIRDNTSAKDVFFIEKNSVANAIYIGTGGKIGIGTSVSATSPNFYINKTITETTGYPQSFTNSTTVNPSSAGGTANYYGLLNNLTTAGTNLSSSNAINGLQNTVLHYSTNDISGLRGAFTSVGNNNTGNLQFINLSENYIHNTSTGSIYSAGGFSFSASNSSTGTITNLTGIFLGSPVNTGTIHNIYGIVIANQRVGNVTSTPYAIHQQGVNDLNYFAGKVGIGTSTPVAKLDVREGTLLGENTGNSQLVSRMQGASGGNNLQSNLYLFRDAAGNDWSTARWHDAIGVDVSFQTPGVDTKTWWERDPANNIQSWGHDANTYMTINGGKVGIGTTTPNYPLTVAGDINTSTMLRVNANQVFTAPLTSGTAGTAGQVLVSTGSNSAPAWTNFPVSSSAFTVSGYSKDKTATALAGIRTLKIDADTTINRLILGTSNGNNSDVYIQNNYGLLEIKNFSGTGMRIFNTPARIGILNCGDLMYYLPSDRGAPGQVLTIDDYGYCYWSSKSGSSSSGITGVVAGNGLNGGGTTGDVTLNINTSNSVQISSDAIQLVGDVATPTVSQYYGTNLSGTRGWYNLPSGGSSDNWGTQVVQHDATLTGTGVTSSLLGVADNGVTSSKIADNSITSSKITDNSITSSDILDNSITTSDIANNSITPAKLSTVGASNNNVLKYNSGTSSWYFGIDETSSGGSADGNNYPTSLSFSGGTLTMGRNNLTSLTVSLDGRYLTTEVDGDITNEIQALTLSGNTLSLSKNGGSVTLPTGGISTVSTDGTIITGDGTTSSKIRLANGTANNQIIKWNGSTWGREILAPWSFDGSSISYSGGTIKLGPNTPSGIQDILYVNGRINSQEVVVQNVDWFDFVFNSDYQLKPLSEVEKFIKENKHLPDIPSEKEVIENGVNLGEMNALLLKKIEELTLYNIEMEKRLSELEKRLNNKE